MPVSGLVFWTRFCDVNGSTTNAVAVRAFIPIKGGELY
jgi:hypothetical protein